MLENRNTNWISAESEKFRVQYTDNEGVKRTYRPDFFGDNTLVEVKHKNYVLSKEEQELVELKKEAANKEFSARGWKYEFRIVPPIKKQKVFELRMKGVVLLEDRYEAKYQAWLTSKSQNHQR